MKSSLDHLDVRVNQVPQGLQVIQEQKVLLEFQDIKALKACEERTLMLQAVVHQDLQV